MAGVDDTTVEIPIHDSNLSFVDASNADDHSALQGDIKLDPSGPLPASHSLSSVRVSRSSQFLERKGFGWLMEVDDIDEDDSQKPLLEELDVDLKDIYYKVRCVLLPIPSLGLQRSTVRDNPDFWGPLLIVIVYSLLCVYGQLRVVSWILTIWAVGSFAIFLLGRVLGGDIGWSQTLGVIGYSLLPLVVTAMMLPAVAGVAVMDVCIKVLGVVWAALSAGSLLVTQELQRKRLLVLYPLLLLYIYFLSLYSGA